MSGHTVFGETGAFLDPALRADPRILILRHVDQKPRDADVTP